MRYLTLPYLTCQNYVTAMYSVSQAKEWEKKKVWYETFPRVLEYIIHYIPPLVSFSIFKKITSSKIYLLSTNSAVSLPSIASSNFILHDIFIEPP